MRHKNKAWDVNYDISPDVTTFAPLRYFLSVMLETTSAQCQGRQFRKEAVSRADHRMPRHPMYEERSICYRNRSTTPSASNVLIIPASILATIEVPSVFLLQESNSTTDKSTEGKFSHYSLRFLLPMLPKTRRHRSG